MSIDNIFYLCMLLAQAYCLSSIVGEAKACAWSAQSRWIAWRAGSVTFGVMIVTALCGWIIPEKDKFSEWVIITALVAMTVLLVTSLLSILKGMTDEEVGRDLNLRKESETEK